MYRVYLGVRLDFAGHQTQKKNRYHLLAGCTKTSRCFTVSKKVTILGYEMHAKKMSVTLPTQETTGQKQFLSQNIYTVPKPPTELSIN